MKIVGVLVALVVVAAVAGLGYLMLAFPKVPPPAVVTLEPTAERLARGKYLSDHVVGCTDCHSERDWTKFSGPVKPDRIGVGGQEFALGGAGVVYGKNITPAAIGSWTDGELQRAVTAGVSKDGTPLFPLMPYPHFGAMAADDMHAVLVYVRSWQAIESQVPPRTLNFPMNLIVRTIPAAATPQPRPSPTDKVAYGKYMTRSALCGDCHTPIDDRGQPLPGREFAGGMEFLETGYRVRAANITPDADTGIGSWTEQQFIDKFKAFETPSDAVLSDTERRQNTPMPLTAYAGMTREDLAAIYAYLRTLPPVVNRVTRFPDAK
ncbi:MAG: c-type cytochrome [Acidobacteriota bacterium]|nr:c-type cytochrome [Acidobacteriota bacterium]